MTAFHKNVRLLAKERDRAKAAEKAKGEFLANMSHEIRTPLNVIAGVSNLLVRTEQTAEKREKLVKTLNVSTDALLALVNDILDFAKLENSTLELESVSFNLEELIEQVEILISSKAEAKELSFTATVSGLSGKYFLGDPTRLRQVLINLCDNAIKFTSKGGVHLEVGKDESSTAAHANIVITVKDSGIGISEKQKKLIFEKFTQADSSITRKYGGTGLGLSISKSFVEKMGGSIQVNSEVGQGTTFIIRLPLPHASENREAPIDKKEADKSPIRKRNTKADVLLVEDYKANALIAESYLESFGLSYEVAVNGAEALEKVKKTSYSAVLMDIQMPVMDGFAATAAIRKYEREKGLKPVKIIGMTAHAMAGDRQRCLNAGMDDYVPKPIDPEDLQAKLRGMEATEIRENA